jgi:hypothetical protein
VGLPRAVLAHEDVHVLAELKLRFAEHGEVLDVERLDHVLPPNRSSCSFVAGASPAADSMAPQEVMSSL